ncbi:hypothetical protein HRR83_006907 [Exophiala dermatitidis]|uniref:Uncharacterized protein n=2 Tax=Exophiala dermatitidis TaxID=5970 RepID=H6BKG6_EXODN|nr:uncharacterized protein HMPREF1120_00811 [Exophiala dermatitidis NIH/UT8656]KAJ4509770.1 hypothetical protein HRR75_005896 [Exophiala dermatitidis]EHY52600.1 hypothetical protein HMPREF1120_00811 [Exophiala dermatitidis NIH/UT8656]KAJ4512391.1 hypothetical protein HRR73_005946 [Exophiala dermatitidis]KAJ4512734.1 hypothetical protein HRR74_006432 [Exophiala dermatitidis]KAJ4542539.1 hypothetical protein HRR77_005737 [Exophiala dermatitidis]
MSTTDGDNGPSSGTLSASRFANAGGASSLEQRLIELYVQTLLSRAHLAFFISACDDTDVQEDSFHQGKAALEEAERLCMSRERPLNSLLVAKCWFVRGFLADVCGEHESALRSFQQAVELDDTYKELKRVQWHFQRDEDSQGFSDGWDSSSSTWSHEVSRAKSGSSGTRREMHEMSDATSSLGNRQSPGTPLRNSKLAYSSSSSVSRESVLFKELLRDVSQAHLERLRDSLSVSPPDIARQPFESPQVNVRGSDSPGRVDFDGIMEQLRNAPPPKRAAPASNTGSPALKGLGISRIPMPSSSQKLGLRPPKHTLPMKKPNGNDGTMAALQERIERSRQEREEREESRRELERNMALLALTGQQPSGDEALLSDTPNISKSDTTKIGSPQNVQPLKLALDTRTGRRPSGSLSQPTSPATPSPLRKASLPGDDVVLPSSEPQETQGDEGN